MNRTNKITLFMIKSLYTNKKYNYLKKIYKYIPFRWDHCEHVLHQKGIIQEFISNDLHIIIIEHVGIERFNFNYRQELEVILNLIRKNNIKAISKIFEDKDLVKKHSKYIINTACASNCVFVVNYIIQNKLSIFPYNLVAASYHNNIEIVKMCLDYNPRLLYSDVVKNTIKANETILLQYYLDKGYKYEWCELECAYEHKCYEAAEFIYMNTYINTMSFGIILKHDLNRAEDFLNRNYHKPWKSNEIYSTIKHTYKNKHTWATKKLLKNSSVDIQRLIIKNGSSELLKFCVEYITCPIYEAPNVYSDYFVIMGQNKYEATTKELLYKKKHRLYRYYVLKNILRNYNICYDLLYKISEMYVEKINPERVSELIV